MNVSSPIKTGLLLLAAAALMSCSPREITEPVARVADGQLRLVDGSVFVARGINLQYGDAPAERIAAIGPIAGVGSNILRLQLRADTTPAELADAIDAAVARGMLVMPFYSPDGADDPAGPSCSNDPRALRDATEKWARGWRQVMQRPQYRSYLLLNIASEGGRRMDGDAAPESLMYKPFTKQYTAAIKRLRKAGYQMPLVIDAPGCGQDFEAFTSGRGRGLLEADPLRNVVLSVHGYWRYRNPVEIDAALEALEAEGVPYVFSEFGNSQFQSTLGGGHGTHAEYLLKRLAELKRGWIAWSWFGNGAFEYQSSLDLTGAVDQVALTPHGELVVNGPYGLRVTAQPVPQLLSAPAP